MSLVAAGMGVTSALLGGAASDQYSSVRTDLRDTMDHYQGGAIDFALYQHPEASSEASIVVPQRLGLRSGKGIPT